MQLDIFCVIVPRSWWCFRAQLKETDKYVLKWILLQPTKSFWMKFFRLPCFYLFCFVCRSLVLTFWFAVVFFRSQVNFFPAVNNTAIFSCSSAVTLFTCRQNSKWMISSLRFLLFVRPRRFLILCQQTWHNNGGRHNGFRGGFWGNVVLTALHHHSWGHRGLVMFVEYK